MLSIHAKKYQYLLLYRFLFLFYIILMMISRNLDLSTWIKFQSIKWPIGLLLGRFLSNQLKIFSFIRIGLFANLLKIVQNKK